LGQHFFPGDPGNAFPEYCLHRRLSGLDLPAMKIKAVIGHRQLEVAAHCTEILAKHVIDSTGYGLFCGAGKGTRAP